MGSVVVENNLFRYVGQVRAGTKTRHGRGACTFTKTGNKYDGEWKDGKMSGHGVYTWADGTRYVGECKDGERSGRGVLWIPGGRTFDGVWAKDCPLQGTAMEPGGALFHAAFDGKTFIPSGWDKAARVPAGHIATRRQACRRHLPPAWEGRAKLADGTTVDGVFRGLRPHGRATLTERGGAAYAAEYDGERTIGEGPMPVSKQASRVARASEREMLKESKSENKSKCEREREREEGGRERRCERDGERER
jgi:hypothetical protein